MSLSRFSYKKAMASILDTCSHSLVCSVGSQMPRLEPPYGEAKVAKVLDPAGIRPFTQPGTEPRQPPEQAVLLQSSFRGDRRQPVHDSLVRNLRCSKLSHVQILDRKKL